MTVVKIVELIGSSPKSWEEAVVNAVKEAAKTVRNIKGVDVKRFTAKCARAQVLDVYFPSILYIFI
jgi:flavin-binding protein dodecin